LTREESKAKTRAELLRAANRLFLRDGYVATSLATIAEEAAVTKGAVYSNFDSKEDLFLALLQSDDPEWTGPIDTAGVERAADFGRHAARLRPSRKQVALFLEMNAAALRSDRTRRWVAAHNAQFFTALGERLRDALDVPDADAHLLGVVAQSLYAGLMMHRAFDDGVDESTFEAAYEALHAVAERSAAAAR
jgi:AcrR family transcriptional regulator